MTRNFNKRNDVKGKIIHLGGRDYRIVKVDKKKNVIKAVRVDNDSEVALVKQDIVKLDET